MANKLQAELKMNKAFRSVEEETILNIARTFEFLYMKVSLVTKQFDLTTTQYNVLRILRGAGESGLSCSDINDRMVTKDSDITRLLDRMENRGLITRHRPADNRRKVIANITDEGLDILRQLDAPMDENAAMLLGHVGKKELRGLNDLLNVIRDGK